MATLLHHRPVSSGHGVGARMVRDAWWSVAAFVLSFVAATVLGDAILSWTGHDSGDADLPWHAVVAAGLPAVLILAAPGVAAWYFGRRAIRYGDERGRTPMIVGVTVAAALVALNAAALVVRLLG